MASTNSTTTPIAGSSLPAGTNFSSSTLLSTSTSSPTTKSTAAGRSPDAWTSTSTFVTVIYSTRKTVTSTSIIVHTAGAISLGSSFGPPSVDLLTQPTTASASVEAPNSGRSSTISSAGKSQRQPSVVVLVVIGLVVASFTAGTFLLICRRRRRRRKEVERIFKRPESRSSFLDTDPFVSISQNMAVMQPVEGEDQRKILEATMMPNWWEPVGNGPLVFKPHLREPRALGDESGATPSTQHRTTQRFSPRLPATYPGIFFEQDGMIGGEARLLERDAMEQNLDRSSTLVPITYPLPPPRPPRSPRRKANRSTLLSLDSVSTTHPSSASPLYRPLPENRLEELSYYGTNALNVQKKSTSV